MEKISRNNRHKFQEYKDKDGNIYHLDEKIGKGREGIVYTVKENPNLVAKIHLNTNFKNTQLEKISAMCNIYDEELAKNCALPQSILYDSCANEVGYVMGKVINSVQLSDIFDTKVNYKNLVRVALNIAKIFDKLYEKNIIVCDTNPKNILITNNFDVMLVDCESFQFEYDNRIYLCGGGTIKSIPPELSELGGYKVYRNVNSSVFGLATLIFRILTIGRNPYIKPDAIFNPNEFYKYQYQYTNIQDSIMQLIFENLSDEIKQMFEQAFMTDGTTIRPTAKEWINALEDYENSLITCSKYSRHFYNPKLNGCLWCKFNNLNH